MNAPKIMCDNVCEFAVSVFSMEPMTFTASVDIGTAAFLNCYGFSEGLVAGAKHRHCARLITYRLKSPYPAAAVPLASKEPRFRNG